MVSVLIGVEAVQLVPSMTSHETYPDYWYAVIPSVYHCDPLDPDHTRNFLVWSLRCLSFELTGYSNFIPLIFNIGIMPMTYLVGSTITKDRLIGFISIVVLINLPLYNDWSSSGTYDMTWAFFVLLSVFFIYKSREWSGLLSIFVGIAAKTMTIQYLPVLFYSAYQNKSKGVIIGGVIGIVLLGLLVSDNPEILVGNSIGFYPEHWEQAVFRNISLLWQVIPMIMGLAVIYAGFKGQSPKGMRDVAIWMGWIILTTPIIHLFTEQLTFTYRFVVFGVFLSVFAGQVLTRLGNWYVQIQLNKQSQIA